MCGIIGYIGNDEVVPILINGLKKLEYRGYDSTGIAVIENQSIIVKKKKGRIFELESIINNKKISSKVGIGHTRWATHGKPSDNNSHPHLSSNKKFAVVHNGIIENYLTLKDELIQEGFQFESETDTEVIAHLLEKYFFESNDILKTIKNVTDRLIGSYAIGIINTEHPDELFATKFSSPLIVGISENENFIASDITAICSYTKNILRLSDGEIVRLSKNSIDIFDQNLTKIHKNPEYISWDITAAEKQGYEHFMLKEIYEQPLAVLNTVSSRITDTHDIIPDKIVFTKKEMKSFKRIYIVGCGSAYHAGIVAKYFIEKITRIPVEVDIASEFRYKKPIIDRQTPVIIISQSGETADTLEALRQAKKLNAPTISIVNVSGSSIATESDHLLLTYAGPEIAVATTKGYSTQLVALYLIGLYFAKTLETISNKEYKDYIQDILKLPELIQQTIDSLNPKIINIAKRFKDINNAYFIGRNSDYAAALEASLKLKEVSYIHSEAYPAGELKHGTISLIEDGTPVIALASNSDILKKTISNIKEVKARGAVVLTVSSIKNKIIEECSDEILYIPKICNEFTPSLEIIPLQLLGYHMAVSRGCDVDKPRNLAKSVTVE